MCIICPGKSHNSLNNCGSHVGSINVSMRPQLLGKCFANSIIRFIRKLFYSLFLSLVLAQLHILINLINVFWWCCFFQTTLAHIISSGSKKKGTARFVTLSATSASTNDVREVIKQAQNELRLCKRKTILFIDEIHRFNKSQQVEN